MNTNYLPTKSNLIRLQTSLKITKQGHELLERKRKILTNVLEKYKRDLALIEDEIKELLKSGMEDIRNANIESGVESITNIANGVKYDTYLDIKNITIYGIEIPSAVHNK